MKLIKKAKRSLGILLMISLIIPVLSFPESVLAADGDFIWAKSMGGTGSDVARSITTDSFGNVYTTGTFSDTVDFDPGAGTFDLTSMGQTDIFISKLDSDGNFLWAKSMDGTSDDNEVNSITTDSAGNVYTTGRFRETVDFDPGPGTFNLISAGYGDIFISKLDSAGNFVWAKRIGGEKWDIANSITTDSAGNVYTTGFFQGTVDFNPGVGTSTLVSAGSYDIFISKLDSNGNFLWAKSMGGASVDEAYSITTDSSGNVYTTGTFEGTVDFDPGEETYNLTSAGSYDIFISKLDSAGNFIWAKSMGGGGYDFANSITTDLAGNVYTTGAFPGTADFDPGDEIFNLSSAGDNDIFISKLDSAGNFVWAKRIGGVDSDAAYSITTDLFGNLYTTGRFYGTVDFDPGVGTFNLSSVVGGYDIFISKLDSAGNFVWAKSMGGASVDEAFSVTTDSGGNIYTTGYFQGTADFDPGAGTFNLISAGETDIFILKLDTLVTDILLSSYRPGELAVSSELSFMNSEDIPIGGIITIDIPSEFTVGDVSDLRSNIVAFTDDGANVSVTAASSTNNKVGLILGSMIDAMSNIVISFDNTLIDKNPIVAGSYEFSVKNYDAGWNEIHSRNANVNIGFGALSNENITFSSIVPSATAIESTFSFKTQNTVPANGYIEITIPNDFSAGNTNLFGHISTFTADSVPVAYTGSLNNNIIAVRPSGQIAGGSDIVLTFDNTIIDQNPSDSGNYEFLINTYDSNHTKNDEGSVSTYISFVLYYIDSWDNILYKINATDLTTISSSEITTNTGQAIIGSGGSAVDPTTNEVYAILQLQSPNGRFLTKLNMETNEATVIGNMNSNFSSLAFDESGQLYGLTGDGDSTNPSSLFAIDKSDASKTLLASYDVNMDGEALTYNNEDQKLYRATGDDMYAINPADPENPETIFEDNVDLSGNSSTAIFHKGGNEYYYISYDDVYNLNISTEEATYFTRLDSGAKNLFELGPASGACSNTSVRFSADPNPITNQTTLCATGEAMQIQTADANSPWTYYCRSLEGGATSTQCLIHRPDTYIDYRSEGNEVTLGATSTNISVFPNYRVEAIVKPNQKLNFSNAVVLGDKTDSFNGTSVESALSALKGGAAISTVDKTILAKGQYAQSGTISINNFDDNISLLFQDQTAIYGETGVWDKTILAPTNITDQSNINGLITQKAIRVGMANEPIVFDKAVRLELPTNQGTPLYSSDSGATWQKIDQCSDATIDSPGSLTFPNECYFKQSQKTYIWTYHFTDFGTFTIEPTLTFDNLFPGRNPGETRLEFTPTLTIPVGGKIELTIPSKYTANDIADLTSNISLFSASTTNMIPNIASSSLINNVISITIQNTAINPLEPVVIVFDNTVINKNPVTTSRYTFNLKTHDNLSALQDYGNINIDLVARFMADLTADANYNDGLANGEGLDDYGLVTGEPEVDANSTNDVYFSQFNRYGNFLASDSVSITVPAGWSVENCGTPTTDVDADGTVDGSMSFTSSTTALYTFSSPTTLATSTGLEFCLSVTSDNNPGNEIVTITSSSTIPETGAVFIYNGERNEVFVTAEVYESLYFQIRDSVDANPTSVCDLGVLNTGQVKECSYRLAVETNAADGFSLFINDVSTNPGLTANSGIDNIDPVTENQVVTAGQEGYGIRLDNATSTTEQGDFTDDDTAIPTTKTAIMLATTPYDWQQGTTTTSSLVTHRAAISATTAGGNYTQTVGYYITANY